MVNNIIKRFQNANKVILSSVSDDCEHSTTPTGRRNVTQAENENNSDHII